ncbi:MAG: hypothetical protein ACOC3T_02165, partial [Bacteroidota bacterium]
MASVTQRIKMIKQPRGGYINPRRLEERQLKVEEELSSKENIHPSLVGLAVDYLTRYQSGNSKNEAFKISLIGANILGESAYAEKLLENVNGLDDQSIDSACKLVGYDVVYRNRRIAYKPVKEIIPDKETISNIRIMVNRSMLFFEEYGPVTLDGFTLDGAYTDLISIGDGDFLTKDTLWDFKVSVNPPKKEGTLQLLVYYLMGLESKNENYFRDINYLGIYNPRL